MAIHPTSVIHPNAQIDSSAQIGPFCVVGPHVVIGPETILHAHVVINHHTVLGARNVIHPFASLGGAPQDLKYRGEPSRLIIGDDNVFRENVTLNIGTEAGSMETRIGNNCLLMAYAHVAHDCILGDNVILANSVGLAGHVCIDSQAILGGLAAIHQFCRIGRLAFIGGGAMVAHDVPPFTVAQGDRAQIGGLNIVGMRRAGWNRQKIHTMRHAIQMLFDPQHTRQHNLQLLQQWQQTVAPACAGLVQEVLTFAQTAQRGLCSMRVANLGDGDDDV